MLINIVLSGDNAIVVGMAAAAAPAEIRQKIIFWGIAGAVILRLMLAVVAVYLLTVVGVLLAGGILDRKSTRLNSSHANISYAVFCLKKKNSDSFLLHLHYYSSERG